MVNLRSQRGDTIVEVLIAIAVVGSVLAIAYATMNRNLQTMRTNQERTEAVERARDQVEALRAFASTTAGVAQLDAQIAGFCLNASGSLTSLSNGVPNADANADGDFAGYGAACTFDELYHVGIRRETDGTGNVNFKVYVRWDKLVGGTGKNEVVIVYRVN